MNYAIIATLGPTSARAEIWQAMLDAGATAFRLNTSHLTLPELDMWLERLLPFLEDQAHSISLVLDLQGSKWRLGSFTPFVLAEGQTIDLIHADAVERKQALPVPHADFFQAAPGSSGEIALNDAKVRLRILAAHPDRVEARVLLGGPIMPHKGITFTASTYRTEQLSDKDRAIFERAHDLPALRFAISYVKDAAEMARYRALLGSHATLIAKLERRQAISESASIAQFADELWVCRGDLGAELGLSMMAQAVASFSDEVRALPVPAIMAGQVLEHMVEHPTPTRSEVCYLYDALQRGYQGFVLSDEAAIGHYPVESCRIASLYRS